MTKTKDYAIIHALAEDYPNIIERGAALQDKVREAISNDWEPTGGFVIDTEGNMYQSMVFLPSFNCLPSIAFAPEGGATLQLHPRSYSC